LLQKSLKSASHLVSQQYKNRAPVEPEPTEEDPSGEVGNGSPDSEANSRSQHMSIADLKIKSRVEAIQTLDKVCDYFEQSEPSSPLPLLLRRARRLSMKSFLEIIQDISPDGIDQVTALGGLDSADSHGSSDGSSSVSSPSYNDSDDDTY